MVTARVTSRGRVTIPKEIRERLGLKPWDRVVFVHRRGEIALQARMPMLQVMCGSVKPRHAPEDFGAVLERVREIVARRRASTGGPE
jgi:AbrB family looped-hinge helix DNA binding protein